MYRTFVAFPTISDMVGDGISQDQIALLLGITIAGDLPYPRYYSYDIASTAIDDGVNAINPTDSIGYPTNAGRYLLKNLYPAIKRQESYSGTSNASGVYSVTFSNPFTIAPNIQMGITNQTAVNQYARVTSISTTGFTINTFTFNTLLGALQLGTSNLVGAAIDVLVTEK